MFNFLETLMDSLSFTDVLTLPNRSFKVNYFLNITYNFDSKNSMNANIVMTHLFY